MLGVVEEKRTIFRGRAAGDVLGQRGPDRIEGRPNVGECLFEVIIIEMRLKGEPCCEK